MRDICILTTKIVPTEELVEVLGSFALQTSQPFERRAGQSVVGEPPDFLWVFDDTAPTNCYFSEEEKAAIEAKLGATAEGCVSVHFTSTDGAYVLAESLAREIGRRWQGTLDYSASGGSFGVPPVRADRRAPSGE